MQNGANFGQNRKKCTFCSKITFWAQKCISGTKMLPGEKGARCPQTFPHRCSKNRRVENVIFVKIPKGFQICALSEIFFTHFPHFRKFRRKIHQFCTFHQTLLKQRPNGVNFGQNRKKCTFYSKITFWAQKCILDPKCTLGPKK